MLQYMLKPQAGSNRTMWRSVLPASCTCRFVRHDIDITEEQSQSPRKGIGTRRETSEKYLDRTKT